MQGRAGDEAGARDEARGVLAMDLGLDPELLELLACPAPDHGPLRPGTPEDAGAMALTCTSCDRRYPVTDGIPVLLLSEASGGPAPDAPGLAG